MPAEERCLIAALKVFLCELPASGPIGQQTPCAHPQARCCTRRRPGRRRRPGGPQTGWCPSPCLCNKSTYSPKCQGWTCRHPCVSDILAGDDIVAVHSREAAGRRLEFVENDRKMVGYAQARPLQREITTSGQSASSPRAEGNADVLQGAYCVQYASTRIGTWYVGLSPRTAHPWSRRFPALAGCLYLPAWQAARVE